MRTIYLDGPEELQSLMDGIVEDFEAIDYTAVMSDELNRLSDLHRGFFNASSGPDGVAWKPNAPSTIRQKGHSTVLRGVRSAKPRKRKGGPKFVRTRWIGGFRLATSLTLKSGQSTGDAIREGIQTDTGGWMKFGTDVEYSGYNDQGTSRIPARPHIGMDDKHLDGMVERTLDYTIKELAKG